MPILPLRGFLQNMLGDALISRDAAPTIGGFWAFLRMDLLTLHLHYIYITFTLHYLTFHKIRAKPKTCVFGQKSSVLAG